MDRYGIITGNTSKNTPKKKAVAVSKKPATVSDLPKNVKKVTEIWRMQDDKITVTLEVSPRDCKCRKCGKKIPKQTPRYRVVHRYGSWDVTDFFHRSRCLYERYRDFIAKFPKRNLDQEDMMERFRGITWSIDSVEKDEYRTKLIRKIINHYVS